MLWHLWSTRYSSWCACRAEYEMEGRVAVFIASLARRYDYSGPEDMAPSFTVWEENGFLILRVELAVLKPKQLP